VIWQLGQASFILFCLRNFDKLRVPLFEQILLATFLSAALFLLISLLIKKFKVFSLDETVALLLISVLLCIVVLPLSLVNVDRSRSFYVLSWVENGSFYSSDAGIQFRVESTEALDVRGVEQRVKEQLDRGLIEKSNGQFHLTPSGRFMLKISNLLAQVFQLENWYLNKN
jgi:hypothetical protein